MKTYKNKSRNSGISHYEIGDDFIIVRFTDGALYTYRNSLSGKEHIDVMKKMAIHGEGLATYINQHPEVRDSYDRN